MKFISNFFSKLAVVTLTLLFSVTAFAQDKKVDVDINVNKNGGNWYTQPWVWIIGAAVFILLLVALLRNNNAKN